MKVNRAFTLIELLVVIAIIAILAAILFPVFAQAKAAAKKTASLSNVKQLALASLMYSNDYDDNWCAEGEADSADGWGWQLTWQFETLPYIKNTQIFLDPSDTHKNDRSFDTGPMFSYPANGVFVGGCSPSWNGWNMDGVIQSNRTWVNNWNNPVNGSAVGLPSQTVLFATRFKMAPSSWMQGGIDGIYSPWATTMLNSDGVDCQGGGTGEVCSFPGQINGEWGPIVNDGDDGVFYDGYGGQSPFAFTDGHAKSMKPSATVNIGAAIAYGNAGCIESGYWYMWDHTRTQ
jgi:prepilin-type N-terminal cleavage/methylation domain-containing protein